MTLSKERIEIYKTTDKEMKSLIESLLVKVKVVNHQVKVPFSNERLSVVKLIEKIRDSDGCHTGYNRALVIHTLEQIQISENLAEDLKTFLRRVLLDKQEVIRELEFYVKESKTRGETIKELEENSNPNKVKQLRRLIKNKNVVIEELKADKKVLCETLETINKSKVEVKEEVAEVKKPSTKDKIKMPPPPTNEEKT